MNGVVRREIRGLLISIGWRGLQDGAELTVGQNVRRCANVNTALLVHDKTVIIGSITELGGELDDWCDFGL